MTRGTVMLYPHSRPTDHVQDSNHRENGTLMKIGINGRFFPANWRPARAEIAFAHKHGFEAIQVHGKEMGLQPTDLDDEFDTVAAQLHAAGMMAVMEIVVRIDRTGRTLTGQRPIDILQHNLSAIRALPCPFVHWHLALTEWPPTAEVRALERSLLPQFQEAVELAERHHFRFGLEHNEPELVLFGIPEACHAMVDAVPGLGFVWDLNHTEPHHLAAFLELAPRMTIIHVADTPLPEVNHHLPLGLGNIDFGHYMGELQQRGFAGPAILEIGGLPKSGGYGRDTDQALVDSQQRLQAAIHGEGKVSSG